MATHYLGTTKDGRLIARKSTRNDFTHAAIGTGATTRLPSFSTTSGGAYQNAENNGHRLPIEVVQVRQVDSAEYRAATKGRKARG
jgi:hypothetical protein